MFGSRGATAMTAALLFFVLAGSARGATVTTDDPTTITSKAATFAGDTDTVDTTCGFQYAPDASATYTLFVTGSCPALAPAHFTHVSDVLQAGTTTTVARFHVAREAAPRRVRRLRIMRAGGRATIRWRSPAPQFRVRITVGDGRRLVFATPKRRVIVPGLRKRTRVRAVVRAVSADGRRGRPRRAQG